MLTSGLALVGLGLFLGLHPVGTAGAVVCIVGAVLLTIPGHGYVRALLHRRIDGAPRSSSAVALRLLVPSSAYGAGGLSVDSGEGAIERGLRSVSQFGGETGGGDVLVAQP